MTDTNNDWATAQSAWTRFMDMHSGGGRKLDWEYIYIEAPQAEAEIIFYNRFGRNPNRVTCTCCGGDYSVDDEPTLAQTTGYERGCKWDKDAKSYVDEPSNEKYSQTYQSIAGWLASTESNNVLIVRAADIAESDRSGDLPEEGYVWAGDDE